MYEGKKVRLRAYEEGDIVKALKYVSDPEIKRCLVPGTPYPLTLKDEIKWFDEQTANGDTYNFAIETIENNEYIGGCGIPAIDWKNSVATVGIFIGKKDLLGKGYGTDAINVLTKFIFEQMNINKIKLFVYEFNKRAIRAYEKCGFKMEGQQRQELYRDGMYYDIFIMGLLKSEFLE